MLKRGNRLKFNQLSSKAGFSLVEVATVFAVTAVIATWSIMSYVGAKKQVFIFHLGNRLQSDVRETFIKSISTGKLPVTNDMDPCSDRVPKVWAMKIPMSQATHPEYEIIPYCESHDVVGQLEMGSADSIKTVNMSDTLNYSQEVKVYYSEYPKDNAPWPQNDGTLYLIYTSPYGRFYAYYEASNDINETFIGNWQSGDSADLAFHPVADPPGIRRIDTDAGVDNMAITFDTLTDSWNGNGISSETLINKNGGANADL